MQTADEKNKSWTPRLAPRLREGEFVLFDGKRCRVDLVNDCRARLRSMAVVTVTIGNRTFKAQSNQIWSVSPHAEVDRLDGDETTTLRGDETMTAIDDLLDDLFIASSLSQPNLNSKLS